MKEFHYEIKLSQSPQYDLSFDELATAVGLHPEQLEKFVENGLIEPRETFESNLRFDLTALVRLRMADRLRCQLGVNLNGIAIIIDLVERVKVLQRENERLRKQL